MQICIYRYFKSQFQTFTITFKIHLTSFNLQPKSKPLQTHLLRVPLQTIISNSYYLCYYYLQLHSSSFNYQFTNILCLQDSPAWASHRQICIFIRGCYMCIMQKSCMFQNLYFKYCLVIMNNSNGFQGGSMLGSSTGFKKRQLLRPASGMLNKKQQFLKAVDISQSEPVIATSLRSEVAAIEEQINLLDKDKRIRQGEGGLQKGYVSSFRKWLREVQGLNDRQDDDIKILKQMGVDSYEAGFRKLWKITGHLDLIISKVTQLQIVHFLLYDEMHDQIGNDSQRSSNMLSLIANNGYTPGTFQITQILLDRSKDVYATCSDLRKKGGNFVKVKQDNKGRQETNELINQLKKQNQKLSSMLEQLVSEKENQKLKESEKLKQNQKVLQKKPTYYQPTLPKQAFKQIEDKYQQQLKYLTSQKFRAEEMALQLRVKVSSLQTQLKAANQSSKSESFTSSKSGSYEEALVEEMQKMKKGFQRKIAILTDQFTNRQRELRKKQADYKNQNQKVKWQKSLLLKKFDMLPSK